MPIPMHVRPDTRAQSVAFLRDPKLRCRVIPVLALKNNMANQ